MNLLFRHLMLCITFFCFFLWSSGAAADPTNLNQHHFSQRIQTESLDVTWNADNPEPVNWKVLAAVDGKKSEWFSLLVPTYDNSALTKHLNLTGQLDNLPVISTGKWINTDSSASPQSIIYRRTINNLLLDQSLTPTDDPYHLTFTIKLLNTGGKTFEPQPDDFLSFSLGPGLGDQRVKGLGYAESMYSFVEPVALIDNKVRRFKPEPGTSFIQPKQEQNIEWIGLHGRYFALLLAPVPHQREKEGFDVEQIMFHVEEHIFSELSMNHLPGLSIKLPVREIAPGKTLQWEFVVFSGPKSTEALQAGMYNFQKLIFPGLWQWMRWLSFGLLWVLTKINMVIHNWGLAILMLAFLVRLTMYPIAKNALKSQRAFVEVQKLMQPELQAIKRNYRGEEQSERILRLYEQQGISPLAGLKPLLIVLLQLPILISLFHVLGSAYELHSAPFLWVKTLAEPDKLFTFGFTIPLLGEYFNILPVIMAISTLLALKLSPTPAANPSAQRLQNVFLVIMAAGFFILFYPFPSGMVLYWIAANFLHIGQQRFFTHKI
jgi:YidC/Oxa1 family membrane protein insertase